MISSIIKGVLKIKIRIFFYVYFKIFGEPKYSSELRQAIDLYENEGFGKLFAHIRAWDAPYDEFEKYVPLSGKIVDLGCGDGLLANYLAIKSKKRRIIGMDINATRISEADKGIKNTKFIKKDVLKYPLINPKAVIFAHVLHHLPSRVKQEEMLLNVSKSLKRGGKLLIIEIDNKPWWKLVITTITDAIIVPILFEGKLYSRDFYYRKKKDWVNLIKPMGFNVKTYKSDKGMPFSHIIIVATKK